MIVVATLFGEFEFQVWPNTVRNRMLTERLERANELVSAFGRVARARACNVPRQHQIRGGGESISHKIRKAPMPNFLGASMARMGGGFRKTLIAKAVVWSLAAPCVSTPKVKNERSGFFEADDFAAVLKELPEALRPVMSFAYLTGWRVRSEVLTLTWDRVDFAHGLVRLEPNTTKNDEPRTFPFDALPELAALLQDRRATTQALERSEGKIIPHVFHRHGRPIKNYYRAWEKACRLAARGGSSEPLAQVVRPQLVGRIVHDFRRTAVRNLVRAGVTEQVAMRLTGHKTREVFERYNITNEADLRAGVAKLATHLAGGAEADNAIENQLPRRAKGTKGGQSRRRAGGESP